MAATGDKWSGRSGFILATIGSAVGLGSIWKFPYEVGQNGGGAFVLFYLLGLVLIVAPLILAEFAIGRRGQADAAASLAKIAGDHGGSRSWAAIGGLGVVTCWTILSFYSVIGGWALAYAVGSLGGGVGAVDAAAAERNFADLLASPMRVAAYHGVFMMATAVVVARGIARGIEIAAKVLMPIMIVLLAAVVVVAVVQGGASATATFLFAVDIEHLTPRAALEAVGLGFFSIGVGLALMVTFAAYADRAIDLRQAAIVILLSDTAISFLAGFAVFPVVFANGLDPAGGPGLVFVTLPIGFAVMPFGGVLMATFFVLLSVAALASAIALLEMPVAYLCRRLAWPRPLATAVAAGGCWIAGLATVFSFNLWADWYPLAAVGDFATATAFDLLDHLTSNVLLPLGGFALAIFAGWIVPTAVLAEELGMGPRGTRILAILLRYVAPVGIAAASLAPIVG